jgi:hypothetical protein
VSEESSSSGSKGQSRAGQAAKIIANPARYKICQGCESIVGARVSLCPNCHSYRYDTRSAAVVAQAQLLARRPQQSILASDLSASR